MAGPLTLYQTGVHGSRPAASSGCVLYSCTTHSLIYKSDGASWTTFLTIPTGTGVATDPIWDAAGDLAVGTGADTAAKLPIGATNGMVVERVSGAVAWALPPGYEYDYVQITSSASITATSEATANTVVTANAVTFNGTDIVYVEFYSGVVRPDTTAAARIDLWLYDGSSSIGRLSIVQSTAAATHFTPVMVRRRLTPSNAAHTYSIRASVDAGTGSVGAGAGGAAASMPAFIRIFKAT